MAGRARLAQLARQEAARCYHGFVMGTQANLQPIVERFPPWPMERWDGAWCAAFVYHCCRLAGYDIPVRYPHEDVHCNFAGCSAWEAWARLPEHRYYHDPMYFVPEPGDIVLFDRVFRDEEHDHIGIVLGRSDACIAVAEGNFGNVSAIVTRALDDHIRGFIRLPDEGDATIPNPTTF